MTDIKKIIVKFPLSLDSVASLWLLRKFGDIKYPGISTAKIEYSKLREYEIEGLHDEGTFNFNFESGHFYYSRAEDEIGHCAFDKVFHALKVYTPSLRKLNQMIVQFEGWREAIPSEDFIVTSFHLKALFQDVLIQNFKSPKAVQHIMFVLFDAHFNAESELYKIPGQIKEAYQVETPKKQKIILLESNYSKAADECFRQGVHVCVHLNPVNDHISISWSINQEGMRSIDRNIWIINTVKLLRLEEIFLRNLTYEEIELQNNGCYYGWVLSNSGEEIWFEKRSVPIFDRSLIDNTRIVDLIREAYNPSEH
ncbi:MAG: hypothetical protein HQM14_09310 [SAR324 cluster bacterium]|nr:hypothetical protein [SAR324 cluster bacterium]